MIRHRMLAVIGVLVGFLLIGMIIVWVQKSREASRVTECRLRLGNIAQAVRRFAELNKYLPPGYLGPNPDQKEMAPAPYVGTLVYLIPHLVSEGETPWIQPYFQNDVTALTSPTLTLIPPAYLPWWELSNPSSGISNRELARRHFSFLLCPSVKEEPVSEGVIVGIHSYGKDGYTEGFLQRKLITVLEDEDVKNWGTTHYLPVAGRYGTSDDFAGHFTNRSGQHARYVNLLLSHSLIFGEALGGYERDNNQVIKKTGYSWFCGPLPTYYGLPSPDLRPWNAFNGPHPQGVMFAWADGHVSPFRRVIEQDESHTYGWDDNPPKKITTVVRIKGNTTDIGSPAWEFLQGCASRAHGFQYFFPSSVIE